MYNLLVGNNLTDSRPVNLADVILVTGLNVCPFLCIRMYGKLDDNERKISKLQEPAINYSPGKELVTSSASRRHTYY